MIAHTRFTVIKCLLWLLMLALLNLLLSPLLLHETKKLRKLLIYTYIYRYTYIKPLTQDGVTSAQQSINLVEKLLKYLFMYKVILL